MHIAAKSQHDTTADTIIDAASEVFADKGYEGARVDELARAAGVNKATLYYQIGDKEAVYHAVITRVLARTADEVCAAVAEVDECEEKIRRFINIFARNAGNMRYAAPIMLREVASGGRNLPESAIAEMGRLLGALGEALREGERSGLFRPVNEFMVHMMIVGSLMLYSANEPIRRRNAERHPEIYNEQHFISNEEAGEQVTDLVLAAIANNKQ
ncbi:MAG: TetR/AcrR family transcriptional regulator [Chromatiales bacterium]|nr:TetR/AcrR family transcriptional regulator [Chromatiales bacterium]